MRFTFLNDFSDQDLEEELAYRKAAKQPEPLSNINWNPLLKYLPLMINDIDKGMKLSSADSVIKQYVFSMVMETVYGKDIWKWWWAELTRRCC
jgi:hypothetical protein